MTKLAASIAIVVLALTNIGRADDVNAAAKAFSQAQQAMLANDPGRAAEMYELADELAPSAAALRNAARARIAANHAAMAATHAAQLLQRYSHDKESREVAEAILSDLAPRLAQLEVSCSEECTITLDGKAASSTRARTTHVFYAQPGARTVGATFAGNRQAQKQLTTLAGGSHPIELEAPPTPAPAAAAPVTLAPAATSPLRDPERTSASSRGIGRKWFVIAAVATAGLGAGATIQGLATLDTRDDITAATAAGDTALADSLYDQGRSQQLRTNVLIGATALTGVTAIVLAVLADWSPGQETRDLAIAPTAGGASLVFGGRF